MNSPAAAIANAGELSVIYTTTFVPVDLSSHFDNRAISGADDTGAGRFNVWGNSFPAEYLPGPGTSVTVDTVPFVLAPTAAGADNIRCAGQYVALPTGEYDWLHLLIAAERRTEDEVALHFTDGSVDFEALRVSDFWAEAPPWFGERVAFKTPVMHYPHHVQRRLSALMWAQRVPAPRRATLAAVRLPRNVAIHVFALTLQSVGVTV